MLSIFGKLLVILVGVAGAIIIAAVGARRMAAAGADAEPVSGRVSGVIGWLAARRDGLARSTDPVLAAVAVLVAGFAISTVIVYAVGLLFTTGGAAHVNEPIDHFMDSHRITPMIRLMGYITQIGNYPVVYAITVTAGVLIGLLWRPEGRILGLVPLRWLPLITLVAAMPAENLFQKLMKKLVHSGKPAQAVAIGPPGGYFSGGSARTLIACGLICCFLAWLGLERRQRILAWTIAAMAAYLEAYSRLYLGRHFLLDILGGWLAGGLIVAVFAFAAGALWPAAAPRGAGEAAPVPPGEASQAAGLARRDHGGYSASHRISRGAVPGADEGHGNTRLPGCASIL